MPFVTFAPKDTAGVLLPKAVVTVYNAARDEILFTSDFGPGALGGPLSQIPTVILGAGNYYASCISDGFLFPGFQAFSVAADAGPSAENPLVIELVAQSSSRQSQRSALGLCVVRGHVPQDNGQENVLRAVVGHGFQETSSFGVTSVTDISVVFSQIGNMIHGAGASLSAVSDVRCGVDRNGFFQATLLATTTYRVTIPGISGRPFITTPAAGGTAQLSDLIAAQVQQAPYSVFGGE